MQSPIFYAALFFLKMNLRTDVLTQREMPIKKASRSCDRNA